MEEILIFIEKCLKKYEYPNIYGSDIAEILGDSNRTFLMSWLYKSIQGEDNSDELTKENLSDFLSTYGFCSTSQLKSFIDMSLDYPVQCQILYRIFKMLDNVKKECNFFDNSEDLSLEAIENFVRLDLNMFKAYGQLKICENVSEKEMERENVSEKEMEHETSKDDVKNAKKEYENLKNLSQMKDKINSTAAIVSDILLHKKEDLNISLNEDQISVLKEFNQNTSRAKELIRNSKILSDLQNSVIFNHVDIPDEVENEYTGMAREIVELIHEINK